MSWNITGKVFVKDRFLFEVGLDRLKSIASRTGFSLEYVKQLSPSEDKMKLYRGGEKDRFCEEAVYDLDSLEYGREIAKQKYIKSKEVLDKMKSLRYTKDYYSFDEEARDNYYEDISMQSEEVDEYLGQLDAFNYACNLMEICSEIYNPEDRYEYYSTKDVVLYLICD